MSTNEVDLQQIGRLFRLLQ